ncbi:lipocalin-like protein [Hydrogenispora ethanolica]|uniref:Lipocalin-like protein n=1 Tax=Hydrogenispora ethanolica TaxID=1082276 RepID=A0A4R1RZC2_HYDET|nr:lipocalin-like domain-containing protein [Hydrogenispora ethanolica]TCL71600.1 lipocalin-like protein [Hydrogenispora ethanolica]
MQVQDLVGVWKLVSWEVLNPSQKIARPFGERPVGYLIYHPHGYVTVTVMQSPADVNGMEALFRKWMQPNASALGFFSFCGRFEVAGETVRHHLEVCSIAEWVGQTQVRNCRFEGERLTLGAVEDQSEHRLVWERRRGSEAT